MASKAEITEIATEKIVLGQILTEKLTAFEDIEGVEKVEKKIRQEIKFLEKNLESGKLTLIQVRSSNLVHFDFLLEILAQQRHIVHLDYGFFLEERTNPLKVDIVCEHGLLWVKAIARNPKAVADAVQGDGQFGAKDILSQAQEYLSAAAQNLCMFSCPKVLFYFSQQIERYIVEELERMGVLVATRNNNAEFTRVLKYFPEIAVLNLDTTTLIAYVSSLCNGGCYFKFKENIIADQAFREQNWPLKLKLDKFFENKQLICCQEANDSFQRILDTLAGPKEFERAKELMQRVQIMNDVEDIPNELRSINCFAKVNSRTMKVIAFGLEMMAITVTANKAFVRSARQHGIQFPVYLHQARALTEKKEMLQDAAATK